MDQFADIRPYNDDEVRPVIDALLSDDEFIDAIAGLRFERLEKYLPWLLRFIVRTVLRRELKGVHDVRDFQILVKGYLDRVVDTTMDGFTVSGVDQLDPKTPYLFMSNHRDIALDPALVNYALFANDHDTVRIAIGDNLLSKPYVSDLMRINKSFIVKRSAKGPRQVFAAFKKLSSYIRHSMVEDGNPIWIAQREGRAKDGLDRTEPAIIKMLAMSQDKKAESFSHFVNALRIVPVSISYELDPCDAAKAQELHDKAKKGGYEKAEHEDLASIAQGIIGEKGHVHVAFGTPLEASFEGADEVAAAVDQQILSQYVLFPNNFFAYKMLHGDYPEGCYSADKIPFNPQQLLEQEAAFAARIEAMPEPHRDYALGIYANPIISQQQQVS